jgi:hypothetical protein
MHTVFSWGNWLDWGQLKTRRRVERTLQRILEKYFVSMSGKWNYSGSCPMKGSGISDVLLPETWPVSSCTY